MSPQQIVLPFLDTPSGFATTSLVIGLGKKGFRHFHKALKSNLLQML